MANEFICDACKKHIEDGKPYASMGGNIEPYMPAKMYHVGCVPVVRDSLYNYMICAEPGCKRPATFIGLGEEHPVSLYDAAGAARGEKVAEAIETTSRPLLFYCEEHGVQRGLTRGISVNNAEPEGRCKDCQVPIEEGHICDNCSLDAEFVRDLRRAVDAVGLGGMAVRILSAPTDPTAPMYEELLVTQIAEWMMKRNLPEAEMRKKVRNTIGQVLC